MVSKESITSIARENLKQAAETLSEEDITQLVDWLSLKENDIRYQSLLLLQERSRLGNDVYFFWDVFKEKLKDKNSYQRSIGALLLAENAQWDKGQKMTAVIDDYLLLLYDEKPITTRQCIQALAKIVPYHPSLREKIAKALMAMDLMKVKETMRKLIFADIIEILLFIRDEEKNEDIESYLLKLLTGEVLDKKMRIHLEKAIM